MNNQSDMCLFTLYLWLVPSLQMSNITYCSGLIFLSHGDLRASSAVILLSGSSSNILSRSSSAEVGMNTKSSLILLRCNFFGFKVWKRGNFITEGQTAGVGVPQSLEIISSCITSALAWNYTWRGHQTFQQKIK